MSPHTVEALSTIFVAEYDVNARLRSKPGDAAPSGTSTKVRRKGTRIPAPIAAASNESPSRIKVPDRFGFGR
jgi:hypothetical protein